MKQAAAFKYKKLVRPREFKLRDLLLRQTNIKRRNTRDGKLAANWKVSKLALKTWSTL